MFFTIKNFKKKIPHPLPIFNFSKSNFFLIKIIHHSSYSYFVSHRTHRNEDLGVDHVFFKPEIIKSNGFDIVSRGSETYQISRSDQILFVDETKILPIELSCTKWIENFSLSDHRPVNVKFIFGENLKKL